MHPGKAKKEIDRALLELHITQVIAQLSTASGEEKERLEEEFRHLIAQRKQENV